MKTGAISAVEVRHKASVDSTNLEVRRCLDDGHQEPLWIWADEQTQGRGREDRAWVSPPGNLYASLLWFHSAPARQVPSLSLVAGLGVRDAIEATGTACRLELKWPNDVLADGQKISGVLVEGVGRENMPAAVIGCGINIATYPDQGTRWPATSLESLGVCADAKTVIAHLADAMSRRLAQWRNGQGVSDIIESWQAHAYGLGATIRIAGQSGRFSGIDATGALTMKLESGDTLLHHAGDVHWAVEG